MNLLITQFSPAPVASSLLCSDTILSEAEE